MFYQQSPESLLFSKVADSSLERANFDSPNFATISKPFDVSLSAKNDTFESSKPPAEKSNQETLVSSFNPATNNSSSLEKEFESLPGVKDKKKSDLGPK